jgi:hypothetical protein
LSEHGFETDIRLNADVTAAISAFHRIEKKSGEGEAQVSVKEMLERGQKSLPSLRGAFAVSMTLPSRTDDIAKWPDAANRG